MHEKGKGSNLQSASNDVERRDQHQDHAQQKHESALKPNQYKTTRAGDYWCHHIRVIAVVICFHKLRAEKTYA